MAGSGPHQAGSHQPEPAKPQQQGNFSNPERTQNEENGRFRKGSVNTIQTSKSYSRIGNHVLQRQNNNRVTQPEQVKSHAFQRQNDKRVMRQEIEDLKMKLYHAQ